MSVQTRSRLLAAAFALASVLALWLGARDLAAVIGAIGRRDGVIAFWSGSSRALPLAVTFFAFTVMLSLPVPDGGFGPTPRGRGAKAAERPRVVTICMSLALAGVLLALVASSVVEAAVGARVQAMGYRACPTIFERPVKRRWALPPAGCPTDSR